MFAHFDSVIESFNFPLWVTNAIIDAFHVLPVLFLIFIIIEIIEFFFAEKFYSFAQKTEKIAPLIGSSVAIIPQCGFSVIASILYVRRFVTKGTLIGIFLATSDEAIPILLAEPTKINYVLPIIILKFFIGVVCAYLIDFVLQNRKYAIVKNEVEYAEGCCKHQISETNKKDLFLHPILHTLHVFIFILVITLILNYFIEFSHQHIAIQMLIEKIKFVEPVFIAIFGLIPNCAASIAIVMLLIKGSIGFGSAMAGLMANAGLGLLVLLRNNNIKDTIQIACLLLTISIVAGMIIQILPIKF